MSCALWKAALARRERDARGERSHLTDGAGALLARGRGTLIEGGVCGLSTLPALVACTHILETLVVSSVTPRTAPCGAHTSRR